MKASQTLLILDGLDEVSEKRLRSRVLQNITSFVNQVRDVLKGDLRVVATTRPHGYSEEFDPTHYLHLTLEKLSPQKAVLYGRQWTAAREPNPREAERILDALGVCMSDKVVGVLTQTPLQVTIILVIIRARGTPPKQREELFERYMDIIYQREQKRRPELLRTEQNVIYGLHEYLAYILHRRAEKDRTAALMDVSEFRKSVEEYIAYTNPLLKGEDLLTQVNQIITEASQRLVLIESPQEGKVGFGLATTREFFAAAHLVDAARDTKERDLRFKAIAKSPHWRNVALFFAGRVGRTRPGEAPSMIDVCRAIDTERADRFLKRGAELVMEMVDDRALREPHNQIGAIQYGLTLLERGFIQNSEDFVKKLMSFSRQYTELVLRPWFKERLTSLTPDNLDLYVDVYRQLFGADDLVANTLERASQSDSEDVKLWALSQAFKSKVTEQWVLKFFEELIGAATMKRLVSALSSHWFNLKEYVGLPLSTRGRQIFASAALMGYERHYPHLAMSREAVKNLSEITYDVKNSNALYLKAIARLLVIAWQSSEKFRGEMDLAIDFYVPGLAIPSVKETIAQSAGVFRDFCEAFSEEDEPLSKLLVSIFSFLLDPRTPEKLVIVSEELRGTDPDIQRLKIPVQSILGQMPEDEEKVFDHHRNLYRIHQTYTSEKQYRNDFDELRQLLNAKSRNIRDHPYRLLFWAENDRDPRIEKFLDSQILSDLRKWGRDRGLSDNFLTLFMWFVRPIFRARSYRTTITRTRSLGLAFDEFFLEGMEYRLKDKRTYSRLWPLSLMSGHEWRTAPTAEELAVKSRLKRIFQYAIAEYSSIKDPGNALIETLYWNCMNAGVAEENDFSRLYTLVHSHKMFPSRYWYVHSDSAKAHLANMLRSGNPEVARLAAVSITAIQQSPFVRERRDERKRIEESWIGAKFRELAKGVDDNWCFRYIIGISYCNLKWADQSEEWLKSIKEATAEELQDAWATVIEQAGYCDDEDRSALLDLIFNILESGNAFPKSIRLAALRRLSEMISETEPSGLDEGRLNLPLSPTTRICLS